MNPRRVLSPERGPEAVGPYSPGIATHGFLFASGNIGIDPASGELVPGGIRYETRQALQNLGETLKAGGSGLEHVLKTTVFLADIDEFSLMNEIYAEYFPQDPPARTTVAVAGLPAGARVEIEAIALARGD